MTRGKLVLWALLGLLVVFGLGWVTGASGRRALEQQLATFTLRLELAESRAAVLDARVSLYNNNFGDASRTLEEARATLARLEAAVRDRGDDEAAARVRTAVERVREAQALAHKLDPAANVRAGDALRALAAIVP